MRCQSSLVALAAFLVGSYASPMQTAGKTWSVSQVATGKLVPRVGAAAYAKDLARRGISVSDDVRAAAQSGLKAARASIEARQAGLTGNVTNTPTSQDFQYLIPVQLGTNKQTLHLNLDTGSTAMWVYSDFLPSNESAGHNLYDPSVSGVLLPDETYGDVFADGAASYGKVYNDTVSIGGVAFDPQTFGVANYTDGGQDFENLDGYIGFGQYYEPNFYINGNGTRVATWFDNIGPSLAENLFTATLKHQAPGSYDFGYINKTKYTGDLGYLPVDFSNGTWSFQGSGYQVQGGTSGGPFTGIADTGTTLLLSAGTDGFAVEYYKQVPSATTDSTTGQYIFDCDATLPDLTFTLGDATVVLSGSEINYAPQGNGMCTGGVQSGGQNLQFNVFGDVFFKAAFVVFDKGNTRIGFAQQA